MSNMLSVKEFALRINKSEETVKRWIRSGKLPNAQKESDKKGWKIPETDLEKVESSQHDEFLSEQTPQQHDRELVHLAYQAVTMTSPTEEMLRYLCHVGIKRTLEILLVMQQSPSKVKNQNAFIKKAISKGWTPTTVPIKKERNNSILAKHSHSEYKDEPRVPFYNWLED